MEEWLQKKVWQFCKNINIHVSHDPAFLILGMYPREMKAYVHKMYKNVYGSCIYSIQNVETAHMTINRWMWNIFNIYFL